MNYKEKEKKERMMKNKQKMNSTNRYKVLKKKQKKKNVLEKKLQMNQ